MLSELDAKMQEISTSNWTDSEKVTFDNEALKSKLFLKKFEPKTPVKKPLSERSVLKLYKKNRVKGKKLFKEASSKKEFRLE